MNLCRHFRGRLRPGLAASPFALLVLAATALGAEPPELDYLFPAGGRVGSSFTVKASGRLGAWPVAVWADDPAIVFKPGATNGEFQVEIAGSAATGPHLVRAYNTEGASSPRLFVVGTESEVTLDPRSATGAKLAEPSAASLPVTVNGRLGAQDQPAVFPLLVSADQVLRARLLARAIDSPAQATMVLLSQEGVPLVATPNAEQRDAELRCPLPVGGTVRLQVTTATNTIASDDSLYRIQVSSEALVALPQPLALTAYSDNVVGLRRRQVPQSLMIPSETRGRVPLPGSNMTYSFYASKNQEFRFLAKAASVGSPLTPVLRVLDWARTPMAESLPAPDADLGWLAQENGDYLLQVSDAQGRGGQIYWFQLEVGTPRARFSAALERDAFRLQRGEACECVVRIARSAGVEGVLQVSALGLPAGVTAVAVHAAPDADQVRLTLSAEPGARPANGPFRITVMSTVEAPPRIEYARFPVRPRHAAPGELLLRDSDQPWLTVLP